MGMDADLFSPADTAALLAIRAVMAERMLGAIELRALFDASGVIRAPGWRCRTRWAFPPPARAARAPRSSVAERRAPQGCATPWACLSPRWTVA
jgi:hypothetical protein